ncbi:MAG: prepilin-type N-terminal cleavage/methylation domain-containing protein [Elusimicrobiaceae bacterium]|nr:prepilin-type N-terminal cleavage/methylation domain-containing protein [Elusimicrobiaceae bacterium]
MKKVVQQIKDTLSILNSGKGFTLIELLVVVLIIGILAAIALPQYQNVVRKARFAEAQVVLRALGDAAARFYLSNENGFNSLEDLDVDISTESKKWDIYQDDCAGPGCRFIAEPKWEEDYAIWYNGQGYEDNPDLNGKFICVSHNDEGKRKCKQLGGSEWDEDDNYYIL